MPKCDKLNRNCVAKPMLDGWEQPKGANIELMAMLLHVKLVVTLKDLEKATEYRLNKEKADEIHDNQTE